MIEISALESSELIAFLTAFVHTYVFLSGIQIFGIFLLIYVILFNKK